MFGLCYPMSTNYHFIIILRTRMFPYKGNYQYPRNARQCSMTSPLSFSQWQPMHAMNCGGFCFWDISVDDSIEDADRILPRSLVCSWLIVGFFSLFSGIQCKHPLNLIFYSQLESTRYQGADFSFNSMFSAEGLNLRDIIGDCSSLSSLWYVINFWHTEWIKFCTIKLKNWLQLLNWGNIFPELRNL